MSQDIADNRWSGCWDVEGASGHHRRRSRGSVRPLGGSSAAYGVSQSWVYELLARYRDEGEAAFQPRSRRPHRFPTATASATIDLIIRIRKQLTESGLDAGPATICWHLHHHHGIRLSVATVARTLTRQSLVSPQPRKRPKASYIRFEAPIPTKAWQSDFTHYRLGRRRRHRDHHLAR